MTSNLLAKMHEDMQRHDLMFTATFSHLNHCLQTTPQAQQGEIYMALGMVARYRGEFAESLNYLLAAVDIFADKDDWGNLSEGYRQISCIYRDMQDGANAVEYNRRFRLTNLKL